MGQKMLWDIILIYSQSFFCNQFIYSGLNIQLFHALMYLLRSKLSLNFNQQREHTEPS